MLQPLCLDTLFPVTRSLLGKKLAWFPGAGLKKNNNHFLERERESTAKTSPWQSEAGAVLAGEEQLQQM